jgi:hypothetical protein
MNSNVPEETSRPRQRPSSSIERKTMSQTVLLNPNNTVWNTRFDLER